MQGSMYGRGSVWALVSGVWQLQGGVPVVRRTLSRPCRLDSKTCRQQNFSGRHVKVTTRDMQLDLLWMAFELHAWLPSACVLSACAVCVLCVFVLHSESWSTTSYMAEQSSWNWGVRQGVRVAGALLMWQIGQRMPKKYNIEGGCEGVARPIGFHA